MKSNAIVVVGVLSFLVTPIQAGGTITISYPNFATTSGLNLVGNTATATGYHNQQVLRLTPAAGSQGGAAWSTSSISFSSASGTFSTFFQFQITNPGGIGPADGIVFAVQPISSGVGGTGGSIGYGGITPSVGVEFDTYQNPWDPNNNHVGIDIDGVLTSVVTATPYNVSNCGSPVGVAGCLANGDLWSVWIDYDGTNLNVALADGSTTRPANILTYPINIPCVLGNGTVGGTGCPTPATTAFFGFTSGTGSGYENHDIVDWQLTNTYAPISGISSTPAPSTLLLLALGLMAAAGFQMRDRLLALVRGSR